MMKKSNIEWCDFTWTRLPDAEMIAHFARAESGFLISRGIYAFISAMSVFI